jgi:paraquat-inducible protein B
VGEVTDVRISLSKARLADRPVAERPRVPVLIALDRERIVGRGAMIPMKMTDEALKELIDLGLRGQLITESFVTGLLYVELDLHPGSPLNLVKEPGVHIREIPTLPTTLQQVQAKASEIVNKLSEIDFQRLVDSLTTTVDGLRDITTSPRLKAAVENLDETVAKANAAFGSIDKLASGLNSDVRPIATSLRNTADQATNTLESVRTLVQPGSPLAYQLGVTLQDLSEAARALKALADELERNPGMLIRGRAINEDHE